MNKKTISLIVFVGPAGIVMVLIILYPLIFSFYSSFHKLFISRSMEMTPVGWQNYIYLLGHYLFFKSVKITMIYTGATVPLAYLLGLVAALLLNTDIKFRKFFRSVFLLPMMVAPVVVAMVVRVMLTNEFGIVNYLLSLLGITAPIWLGTTKWALFSVVMVGVWITIPFNFIILLAGLQGIPTQIYEAAKIDGCSNLQSFGYITFPLLKPMSVIVVMMGIVNSFKVFEAIYALTSGGPGNATLTLTYYAYSLGFNSFRLGRAAASSTIIFLIALVVTLAFLRVTKPLKE